MNYLKSLVAVAIVTTAIAMTNGSVKAEKIALIEPSSDKSTFNLLTKVEEAKPKPVPEVKAPVPVEYTVAEGDTLTSIAEKYSTTWVRLWQKNTNLSNENVLKIGDRLVIPTSTEILAERQLSIQPVPQVSSQSPSVGQTTPARQVSYNSAGNGYATGYCTWYVKNRRPDLPNNLGNANTWAYMAQNAGYATGYAPRVGSVGTTTAGGLGHVVFVEAVNGDGTVSISEMNWNGGIGVVHYRVTSASEFFYIY